VDAIEAGQRVLLVDDLLATGGTMKACCDLVKQMRATIVGITVLIELTMLNGRAVLHEHGDVHSVLKY
jgi:adenine phosphoribosyltransferase